VSRRKQRFFRLHMFKTAIEFAACEVYEIGLDDHGKQQLLD
jgi:hypothetical protein